MITKRHTKGDAPSTAVYSSCEGYRLSLTRVWEPAAKRVLFIMLNPSTATEVQNDPTIERCEQRARKLGFGGFRVVNIFALRATHPRDMRAASDPVGSGNDAAIREATEWADMVIAAWGIHGAHLNRGRTVETALRGAGTQLWHLGLTKDGHPRHPLYLAYSTQPRRWTVAEVA